MDSQCPRKDGPQRRRPFKYDPHSLSRGDVPRRRQLDPDDLVEQEGLAMSASLWELTYRPYRDRVCYAG
jgi:hypothetical protein